MDVAGDLMAMRENASKIAVWDEKIISSYFVTFLLVTF